MFIKDTKSAYKILEITPDASDDEIKKAYRKMAVKYHPDKVSHLGGDVVKAAKEKFQKLNTAYNQIKKEREIAWKVKVCDDSYRMTFKLIDTCKSSRFSKSGGFLDITN